MKFLEKEEKQILKISGKVTVLVLFFLSIFWFLFSIQPCKAGYSGGPPAGIDVGINSRSTSQTNWQVGSSGVYVIRLGIENVTGVGTATGYMNGTNTFYPRIEWTPTLGTLNFIGTGSYNVTLQTNGVNIPSSDSVAGKINIVGGTGTGNTFDNTNLNSATLSGSTTVGGTSTITADGTTYSATKLKWLATSYEDLQIAIDNNESQINAHSGSSTGVHGVGANYLAKTANSNQIVGHNELSGITANDHHNQVHGSADHSGNIGTESQITFGTQSGHSHNGIDSTKIDYNTAPVQLGTDTSGNSNNISEGSINKYYTDSRVDDAFGSQSIHNLSDVADVISEGDFLKKSGGQIVGGSNTVSVMWADIGGSPTGNANIKVEAGTSTIPFRDSVGNLFASGVVGGTTTGALKIPIGTNDERPSSPINGMIRYNNTSLLAFGTPTASGGIVGTESVSITQTLEFYSDNNWYIFGTGSTTIGTYTSHTFTSSGDFVIAGGTKTVEVFIVAGGGGGGGAGSGGGNAGGGGGGGGGIIYQSAYDVSGTVTVVIGAGGTAGVAATSAGGIGNNSSFGTLVATGGGGGGTAISWTSTPGGSGGGASFDQTAGTGTVNQGYDGGAGNQDNNRGAGGGGGGGAVGIAGTGTNGGNGGTGYTFASNIYSGGGGGGTYNGGTAGTGGSGGGGNAGTAGGNNAGSAGSANTGGGGGGASILAGGANGGVGGSGIVIVRYRQ